MSILSILHISSATTEQPKAALHAAGHDVRLCADAEDATTWIQGNSVDLVVISITDESAVTVSFCHALRQLPQGCTLPILLVAESGMNEQLLAALSNGADDYILRPFGDSEFSDKIADLLDKTHVRTGRPPPVRDPELFIGSYEIVTDLGSGSFSTVYHAIDCKTSNNVALKVFDADTYQPLQVSLSACFLREAYEMSKLDHPNIVKLLDFGKHQNSFYLVMEYIRGKSLENLVQESGPLNEENLIILAYQITLAFECLEQHNAVHRDIKPDNILIAENGNVKLTDFGLAKQQDDSSLTQVHHQFMGTPNFVAPEQIHGYTDIDVRCDVYSLGATIFYCATQMLPFAADGVVETLSNNMNEDLPRLCDAAPGISHQFSEIVDKMLMKEPEDRFTPTELKATLLKMMEE